MLHIVTSNMTTDATGDGMEDNKMSLYTKGFFWVLLLFGYGIGFFYCVMHPLWDEWKQFHESGLYSVTTIFGYLIVGVALFGSLLVILLSRKLTYPYAGRDSHDKIKLYWYRGCMWMTQHAFYFMFWNLLLCASFWAFHCHCCYNFEDAVSVWVYFIWIPFNLTQFGELFIWMNKEELQAEVGSERKAEKRPWHAAKRFQWFVLPANHLWLWQMRPYADYHGTFKYSWFQPLQSHTGWFGSKTDNKKTKGTPANLKLAFLTPINVMFLHFSMMMWTHNLHPWMWFNPIQMFDIMESRVIEAFQAGCSNQSFEELICGNLSVPQSPVCTCTASTTEPKCNATSSFSTKVNPEPRFYIKVNPELRLKARDPRLEKYQALQKDYQIMVGRCAGLKDSRVRRCEKENDRLEQENLRLQSQWEDANEQLKGAIKTIETLTALNQQLTSELKK